MPQQVATKTLGHNPNSPSIPNVSEISESKDIFCNITNQFKIQKSNVTVFASEQNSLLVFAS